MRFANLRWWAVLLPTVAIILVDYARHTLVTGWMHPWNDEAALLAGVLIVSFGTARLLIDRLDRSERREREAETLRGIGVEVTSTLEMDVVLASVLARGREVLGVDCVGVSTVDSDTSELVTLSRGQQASRRVRLTGRASFLKQVVETAQWKEQLWAQPSHAEGPCDNCRRCLGVPLKMGSQLLGTLCIGSTDSKPFKVETQRMAGQIATLASVAIANAQLHRRVRDLATLEERDRIAREMHDSLAQMLGYLSMKAGGARDLLRRGERAKVDGELAEMGQVADEAYQDVREAILGLRAASRSSESLEDVLREYLEKFSRQSGVVSDLVAPSDGPLKLPASVEIQLVRVIQEALTNVRKHARASEARVVLERRDGEVRVSVADNGRGLEQGVGSDSLGGGYGMTTMRERLDGIGGRLAVESAPGKGTVLQVTIPLPAQELYDHAQA